MVGAGQVDLDHVSLCPEKTWKNRPHGLAGRPGAEALGPQARVLAFPRRLHRRGETLEAATNGRRRSATWPSGGCIINRWNTEFKHRLAPDYFQSFGVGFFEYFQLCEDIGAEPLPILNCGMACQFNTGELVPLDELGPYIQDALDLIEFANGPVTSPWGAKRAAMGHPEPFGMKLLGVGNEQWGPQYFERYERFAAGDQGEASRDRTRLGCRARSLATHVSSSPGRCLRELKADDRRRALLRDARLVPAGGDAVTTTTTATVRKVFMGEYAAQSVGDLSRPTIATSSRCALAEAAFITGLERN